uniref:Putative secreted histamine binding protein of 33.2 kDa n=1 Tax=Ixodes ricinus TaxID=34613 RepID=V5GJX4_IXORI
MGLLYAALFACIATTSAWQAQMTIRNPENNPLLNDPKYGPLQNAWKALERNDTYVLLFRSKNYEPNVTCVKVKSNVYNETLKIANYTRTYLNITSGNMTKLQFQVRALNLKRLRVRKCNTCRLEGKRLQMRHLSLWGANMYIQ